MKGLAFKEWGKQEETRTNTCCYFQTQEKKNTAHKEQMRPLEDQSEELSYLRINVTTIKLSHLKIFKKKTER